MGKPSGIGAARKLVNIRRDNKWADKAYRKKRNGALFKVNNYSLSVLLGIHRNRVMRWSSWVGRSSYRYDDTPFHH